METFLKTQRGKNRYQFNRFIFNKISSGLFSRVATYIEEISLKKAHLKIIRLFCIDLE